MARNVRVIERRTNFDDICTAHVETGDPSQETNGLARGQPAGDRSSGTGCERGIDSVDIKRDVDRALSDALADFAACATHTVLTDFVGTHEHAVVRGGEAVVILACPRAANAELIELAPFDQALVERMPNGGAVMKVVTPRLGAAQVEVGIDVDDRERTDALGERAHHGQRDRVIATEDDRHDIRHHELADFGFDRGAHRCAVEGREHDVARIDTAQAREDVDVVHRMVVLQQRRDASDVIRRKARTGLIRRASIVGDRE